MKKCSKCGESKDLSEFHKNIKKHDGYQSYCISCFRNIKRDWYLRNIDEKRELSRNNSKNRRKEDPDKFRKKSLEYYYDNLDKMRLNSANYAKNNRSRVNFNKIINHKKRFKNDNLYKISFLIRRSIRRALKKSFLIKKSKTEEILGCSFKEFKIHLESQFKPWMNWDNHGLYNGEFNYGWDIDHIIPISYSTSEDEFLKLNHYSNLQPLCSKINRDIKNDKINYEEVSH